MKLIITPEGGASPQGSLPTLGLTLRIISAIEQAVIDADMVNEFTSVMMFSFTIADGEGNTFIAKQDEGNWEVES